VPPELVNVFKALAHESRLRLLGLTAQREHSVQELAAAVGVTEPTASHHLAMLRALGLVSRRVEGNTHWYAFESATLQDLAKRVLTREGVARLAADTPRRDAPETIVANYLDADGRLTRIPATRKKRHAILAWLVRKFDQDRRYPEREINELLLQFHWDSATLRREFIGYQMMRREAGIYWRTPDAEWRAADGAAPIA
jgi:DNA-binding transcriptional ArsR family regulator